MNEGGDRDKLGRGWVWNDEIADCIHQNHVFRLRRRSGTVVSEYVSMYANAFGQQWFINEGAQTTNLASISSTRLALFPIPLPPLAEQRRIVARIEALFARTRRARTELERVAPLSARHRSAMLTNAACGTLTEPWRQAGPTPSSTLQVLSSIRRERRQDRRLARREAVNAEPDEQLPAGWAWVSPDEVADNAPYSIGIGPFGSNLVQGDYQQSGVRLVFVRDIRRQQFDAFNARYVTPEKAAELHPHAVNGGEVLITKMGEPPGDTAIYPKGIGSAVITADCIKLKPHPLLGNSEYLAHIIRSQMVAAQIGNITKGVAQQKVSLEAFRRIALPLPPSAEQDEIVRMLDASNASIGKAEQEATRALALLDRLEQAILAKAFRGELVPQDPSEEPATALLARLEPSATAPRRGRPRQAARV